MAYGIPTLASGDVPTAAANVHCRHLAALNASGASACAASRLIT